ncbi:hypothetical protein BGW36DRAFT_422459 [Talaromyces proteolyticus]|uniref:Uncharacterized protein n=1 Tax=Talaromyces proteolyticus TaxID=1131652 RepID=A0AAD4L6C2_9EURO|nr:uncharacterized protein BGW36DRAFT_422459 [Talaromyces proteolyticus]KAH8705931.1 hypothetical protein BGW36DRAFT_422459 [Talaromyces proteolyticus]
MQQYSTIVLLLAALHGLPAFAGVLQSNIELAFLSRTSGPVLSRREPVALFNDSASPNKNFVSLKQRLKVVRSTTPTNLPNVDEAAFNQSVTTACANAVKNYTSAVNPSGIVACYNVAAFDNSTGIFETDVRLYQKSAAFGEFQGIAVSDYSMSFSIPEATVSSPQLMVNGSTSNTPASGQLLMGFQNVGQLSKTIQFSKLTTSDLKYLMVPAITLSATTNTGTVANTSLASDMISYVAGQLTQGNGAPTNITTPEAVTMATAIAASASVFVLPGTNIMVAPVGLIITCIWSGLLIAAVGAGTIGRFQYRMQYRRAQPGETSAFGK